MDLVFVVDRYSTSQAVLTALDQHIRHNEKGRECHLVAFKELDVPLSSRVGVTIVKGYFGLIGFLIRSNVAFVFCPNAYVALALYPLGMFGIKRVYWVQGIAPEESFLKRGSRFRYIALSIVEYAALIAADIKIFVTGEMRLHFIEKYKLKFRPESYGTVRCHSELKLIPGDRDPWKLVYIGGMQPWQKVDEVLEIFDCLWHLDARYSLSIYTLEVEKFEEFLEAKDVRVGVTISAVRDRSEVQAALNQASFGFLLRDNIAVNRVASPIKLLEYLSCGVAPIMSPGLREYFELLTGAGVAIPAGREPAKAVARKITEFCVNPEKVRDYYDEHFSDTGPIAEYSRLLQ